MLQHKDFLSELHKENKNYMTNRKFQKKSVKELNVLIRILGCIAKGHIPITSEAYRELNRSKRRNRLAQFGKTNMNILLGLTKPGKIELLRQLCSNYPLLLKNLFVP